MESQQNTNFVKLLRVLLNHGFRVPPNQFFSSPSPKLQFDLYPTSIGLLLPLKSSASTLLRPDKTGAFYRWVGLYAGLFALSEEGITIETWWH
jgi:hypothetical protein